MIERGEGGERQCGSNFSVTFSSGPFNESNAHGGVFRPLIGPSYLGAFSGGKHF